MEAVDQSGICNSVVYVFPTMNHLFNLVKLYLCFM